LRVEAQEIKSRRLAGVKLLNKTKGGEGGSIPREWNYEKARDKAMLCKDKGFNHFQKTYGGAFIWLYNHGLLRQCLKEVGMIRLTAAGVPRYEGTLELALRDAEPFLDWGMRALRNGAPQAYRWLAKHGHLGLVKGEFAKRQRQRKIERLREMSRHFTSRGEFARKNNADYQVALRLRILDQLFPAAGHPGRPDEPDQLQDPDA
jgi:hypothetical protein